jgi:bacillithiol system protein YtxJ
MSYKILNEFNQLTEIDRNSNSKIQVLFKHSTRCSVSLFANKTMLGELSGFNDATADVYYLDLIAHRNISNEIALRYNVIHESPQILVIENGKCIYSASHDEVSLLDAVKAIGMN